MFMHMLTRPRSGAPRSGRGGRRFKSCHSDQLSYELKLNPTDIPTESGQPLNRVANANPAEFFGTGASNPSLSAKLIK